MTDTSLLTLTADIVAAHVSNNDVSADELPALIASVHQSLADLGKPVEQPAPELKPAVSIRASVKPDHIVCLEDGRKLKTLKRYLRTRYNMTPEEYRAKWNLPADYPMVAPDYADRRRSLAHQFGLGRKAAEPAPAAAAPATEAKAPEAPTDAAPAEKKPRASRKKLSIAAPQA